MHDVKFGAQFLKSRSNVSMPVRANVANVIVYSILLLAKVIFKSLTFMHAPSYEHIRS